DRGGAVEQRCPAKPGEVHGEGTICLGQRSAYAKPVESAAAKAMHHQQRLARASEIEVVDRSFEVDDLMPHCVMNATSAVSKPGAGRSPRLPMESDAHPYEVDRTR